MLQSVYIISGSNVGGVSRWTPGNVSFLPWIGTRVPAYSTTLTARAKKMAISIYPFPLLLWKCNTPATPPAAADRPLPTKTISSKYDFSDC